MVKNLSYSNSVLKPKAAKLPYLSHSVLNSFITASLSEDIGNGDHTTLACIPKTQKGKAALVVKEAGIVAGVELASLIFKKVNPKLKINLSFKDGDRIKKGDVVFTVTGSQQSIVIAERLVLNCMQRMSGIATQTNKMVALCKGTHAKLLDTRKTTPGFRAIEKWAVKIGGGENHRFGLFDMILIKDNHVDFCGGIENAIRSTNNYLKKNRKNLKIEIEVRNLTELKKVLLVGGVDRILLDNFSTGELRKAIALVNGRFETEASGSITEANIKAYAKTGVDYISVGALTHSYKSLDLSLKAV
jgi:nicotinate-nucleotide pyrophosphorylase (carboxylating)